MTEIPEHLLKRSKAAKSGKSGDADGAAGTSEASSAPVASQPATPAAAAPAANLPNLDPPPPPAKPVPAYVEAARSRKRIPVWVLPVIAALPVWALSYAGTMQQPETEDILFVDAALIYGSCSGCHGAAGGGGVGYALTDGEVLQTFPNAIDQMVHVARGSDAIAGEEYGAVRADGTRRVSGARGRGPMRARRPPPRSTSTSCWPAPIRRSPPAPPGSARTIPRIAPAPARSKRRRRSRPPADRPPPPKPLSRPAP